VTATLTKIPVAAITPGNNDRRQFDEVKLNALADSIATSGLAEPIVVVPAGDGYRLVAGERRWRAHQILGWDLIDAIVRPDLDDTDESNVMLAENTARVDLSPMEEARAYQARIDIGQTVEEIATIAGVAEFRVRWRLDLLGLVDEAQQAIEAGALPPGPALELRKLNGDHQRIGLKAWLANPTMGAQAFRKLTDQLLVAQSKANDLGGLFADEDEWVDKAKAMKRPKLTVPTLAGLVRRLANALEDAGYDGPLLEEARTI
jgi:ParB family chromosome partitioning protein